MNIEAAIKDQLNQTVEQTNFPEIGEKYQGKVRDVYQSGEQLVIVTTDRVSAFDHVLGTIPFKGQILNRLAAYGFEQTKDIAQNHVVNIPDPNILVGQKAKAYAVEFIVRGYITGSLWRDYQSGKASAYGIDFPSDLKKDQAFAQPILTPSTKAELGLHDEPISMDAIVERKLMTQAQLDEAEDIALKLYARGVELAAKRGLILVDTKYEMGLDAQGKLTVIDEIHTPDSSRYWVAAEYETRFAAGQAQAMLDKENLRQWLIETHGFSGEGQAPPLDDKIRTQLACKYADLYQRLTGETFIPIMGDPQARMRQNLIDAKIIKAD
jgi:phosphoribosylaminoimidazole-succinocarboxamide synthase